MTNRERLIKALEWLKDGEDPFDDGGAGAESIIAYRISCPHHAGAGKYACDNAPWPIDTLKVCGPCIQEWLMQEAKE